MEGPSLAILKDEIKHLKGLQIIAAKGISKIDKHDLIGKTIKQFKTWGKHFLIILPDTTIRVHFLMFGSYRIDGEKSGSPQLSLILEGGHEINLYACAIRMIDGKLGDVYDWSADVMSTRWDASRARKKLKSIKGMMISDALLDQNIFSGVGNIIKNEVLFRVMIHPESMVEALPPRKLTAMINEARNYSFDFLRWKKKFELKKHWLIFTKKKCPRCSTPAIKKYTGKAKRRSFFCPNCQTLYR
ncbi:endonuclease [Pseudochryseolinea flava]|uniref:Endonuclease n=1 Tax=Pseudochryseolinea flava TaxID=2059302 RepID=A0A364Y0G5_9BACT|nr:endonuclease [Pseudochryseolinea flava]RAW00081.1 endonuclease [Pseudochryseolinea flava]